jgi:hypothetical protein
MKAKLRKVPFIFSAIYFVAVVTCIYLAFDYEGRTHMEPLWVLILLTLPWSLVSILFAWALIHGAGLTFFTLMYLVFGVLNAWLLYKLFCSVNLKKDLGIESKFDDTEL